MKRYRSIDLVFENDYREAVAKKMLYTDDNPGGIDSDEPIWEGSPSMSVACVCEIDEIEIKEGFTF